MGQTWVKLTPTHTTASADKDGSYNSAIKSQKDSDGSADYCESIGRLGLMVGAAAQAAAVLAPPRRELQQQQQGQHQDVVAGAAGRAAGADVTAATTPYEGVLRRAMEAFTEEALDNDRDLMPKVAAALDAALGSCGGG